MEYTIIANGQSYDLPKKTLDVVAELDEVMRLDDNKKLNIKQKYEKMHSFLKKLIGVDETNEILGSENLNEIDLSELTILVQKVNEAYLKPVTDYASKKAMDELNSMPIDKIVELAKVADRLPANK